MVVRENNSLVPRREFESPPRFQDYDLNVARLPFRHLGRWYFYLYEIPTLASTKYLTNKEFLMKKPSSQARLHQSSLTRKAQKRKIKLNEAKRLAVAEAKKK